MALDILEWGVIAVIGISIFLFGPDKGADIAKKLGAARRDLDAATKQLSGMSKELGGAAGTGGIDGLLGGLLSGNPTPVAGQTPGQIADAAGSVPGAVAPQITKFGDAVTPAPTILGASAATTAATTPKSGVLSGDRLLVDMARTLGISTQGKTRDDIQGEIIARAAQAPANPAPTSQPQAQSQEPPTTVAS